MISVIQLAKRAIHSRRMEANAFFLWSAVIFSAAVGFLFWNIAARFFPSADVGLASAMISLASLLSGIAGFGIGMGIVRYMSSAGDRMRMVNTALTFTALTSLLVGTICVAGIDLWAPGLGALRQPWQFLIFILLLVSSTHNILLQMVFLSLKRSSATFGMAILLNALRLVFLLILQIEKAQGIVVSLTIATVFSNGFGLFLLPRLIPGYSLAGVFSGKILQKLIPYSFGINMADFLNAIPVMLAPLLALENLGATASANTYIVWMMGSMILSPSTSLFQSAFSEGASEPWRLMSILRKSGMYSLLITFVLAILGFFLSDWILAFFGPDYRGGTILLKWLCLAAPVRALDSLFTAAFRVQKRLWTMIFIRTAVVIIFFAPQIILLKTNGLSFMGSMWMTALGVAVLLSLAVFLRGREKELSPETAGDSIRGVGAADL
jgi:O-antigen/teichoic acid export membrane protein